MKFVAKHENELVPVEVERAGDGYQVTIRDRSIQVDLISPNPFLRSIRLEDGTQYLLIHHREGRLHQILLGNRAVHLEIYDPLALQSRTRDDDIEGGDGVIRAVMPGRVVRVLVGIGDEVVRGAGLLIVEAMKMENEITVPRDGKVRTLHVEAGQTVDSGAELVTLE